MNYRKRVCLAGRWRNPRFRCFHRATVPSVRVAVMQSALEIEAFVNAYQRSSIEGQFVRQ